MSYVRGPGYELYVPVDMARHVYLSLHEARADLGLKDAGYCAIDALCIEAGLQFAVKLDKGSDFIGRDALLRVRDQPLNKKLLSFVFDSAQAYAWDQWPPKAG